MEGIASWLKGFLNEKYIKGCLNGKEILMEKRLC